MSSPRPTVWCAFCHRPRDPSEVLAFWPIDTPNDVRYVCRPSLPQPTGQPGTCFSQLGSAAQFTIAGPNVRTFAGAA